MSFQAISSNVDGFMHPSGLYFDLDLWPVQGVFTEDTIPADVDFWSFSDYWNRPTQGFFAMTPGNPVGYYTIQEILSRILDLQDISKLKLVFLSGPELLKMGYRQAFYDPAAADNNTNNNDASTKVVRRDFVVFEEGRHYTAKYNITAFKSGKYEEDRQRFGVYTSDHDTILLEEPERIGSQHSNTSSSEDTKFHNTTTRREKIQQDTGIFHWQKERDKVAQREDLQGLTCREYLYRLEEARLNFPRQKK